MRCWLGRRFRACQWKIGAHEPGCGVWVHLTPVCNSKTEIGLGDIGDIILPSFENWKRHRLPNIFLSPKSSALSLNHIRKLMICKSALEKLFAIWQPCISPSSTIRLCLGNRYIYDYCILFLHCWMLMDYHWSEDGLCTKDLGDDTIDKLLAQGSLIQLKSELN